MRKLPGKRRGVISDKDRRNAWFLRDETRCDICGIPWGMAIRHRFPSNLCVHHIIQGAGRSDEECNFLRVCNPCHAAFHGTRTVLNGQTWPRLKLGHALRIKRVVYPLEWDLKRLCELAGYASPPPRFEEEDLPEFYLAERRRWRWPHKESK